MSNITFNIVEPGSSTPIDPVVPNTGLFTSGIGSTEATIITVVSAVLILTIVAIVLAVLYKKHKKQGRTTKLVHMVDTCKFIAKSKKRITAGLSAIALLASAGTLTTLLASANKNNTNAVEGDDSLTLDISGGDITIELAEEPVFAIAEVKATVTEETPAGYTLTAYTDNTDLVSATDPSKVIPMVAVDEGELTALADNAYGLALGEEPTTKDAEVYMSLSIDSDTPTILKATDYVETEANDTTTIYYGFYITPDIPYGTYTGTDINYAVEPHYITNLSFDGNGNDGGVDMEGMTIIAGDTITLPENTYTKEGYNFIGWNTVAEPTEQDPGEVYEDQAEYIAELGKTKDVTLYAQWEEATLYMQDVASWGSKLEIGDEIIAVDNRDNKEYYVARLADGNIWMTQNLDFNIVNGGAALDSTNTDVPTDWADAGNLANTYTTSTTTWNSSITTPESYDPGDLCWDGIVGSDIDEESCNENNSHYHLGNYYNWTAAVAMSSSISYTTTSGADVDQSICPAGWMLPKSGDQTDSGSFAYLRQQYSSTNMWNEPLYFPLGGYYSRGMLEGLSNFGSYWSGVVYNIQFAYSLSFDYDDNINGLIGYRDYGYPLRCVAR